MAFASASSVRGVLKCVLILGLLTSSFSPAFADNHHKKPHASSNGQEPVPCEVAPDYSGMPSSNGQIACFDFDKKNQLPFTSPFVMKWLKIGGGKCKMRALVKGTIVRRFSDIHGHSAYGIDIDGNGSEDVSLIYQNDFGPMPELLPGSPFSACGDFIRDLSHLKTKDGADVTLPGLVHWVHSNDGAKDHGTCVHPDGYVKAGGKVFGVSPPGKGLCH